VSSGTESARTTDSLVDGALVDTVGGSNTFFFGDKVDDRQIGVEFLGVRIVYEMCFVVLLGPFQIHAIDVGTIFWLLL